MKRKEEHSSLRVQELGAQNQTKGLYMVLYVPKSSLICWFPTKFILHPNIFKESYMNLTWNPPKCWNAKKRCQLSPRGRPFCLWSIRALRLHHIAYQCLSEGHSDVGELNALQIEGCICPHNHLMFLFTTLLVHVIALKIEVLHTMRMRWRHYRQDIKMLDSPGAIPSTYQNMGREASRPPISSKVWAVSSKQSRYPFAYPHVTVHVPCFCDFWVSLNNAEKSRFDVIEHLHVVMKGGIYSSTQDWLVWFLLWRPCMSNGPMDHHNSLTHQPHWKKNRSCTQQRTTKSRLWYQILGVNNQKTSTKWCNDIQPKQIQDLTLDILQPTWSPTCKIPLKLLWGRCDRGTCWCYFDAWD